MCTGRTARCCELWTGLGGRCRRSGRGSHPCCCFRPMGIPSTQRTRHQQTPSPAHPQHSHSQHPSTATRLLTPRTSYNAHTCRMAHHGHLEMMSRLRHLAHRPRQVWTLYLATHYAVGSHQEPSSATRRSPTVINHDCSSTTRHYHPPPLTLTPTPTPTSSCLLQTARQPSPRKNGRVLPTPDSLSPSTSKHSPRLPPNFEPSHQLPPALPSRYSFPPHSPYRPGQYQQSECAPSERTRIGRAGTKLFQEDDDGTVPTSDELTSSSPLQPAFEPKMVLRNGASVDLISWCVSYRLSRIP
jgi:hypothetical protein